jgi:type II secretory pathway pseudopilin PulG
LAEVLITLAIIGVVAALTIPTVVQNYKKTQTLTQLKKVYSALSNTTNLAILDYGPIETWEMDEGNTDTSAINFANKYLVPYLKVSKNCENKHDGDCLYKAKYLGKTQEGTFGRTLFYLNDGTIITLYTANEEANENHADIKIAFIFIDINGQKKPNIVGKDLFAFNYYVYHGTSKSVVGKFIPRGMFVDRNTLLSSGYNEGCNKESEAGGLGCAGLIVKDGWQISNDYPWN